MEGRREGSAEEGSVVNASKDEGQGLVEYALLLMLVALVVIVILVLTGTTLSSLYTTITSALSGVFGS